MRKRRQTTAPAAARPPRHVAPIRPGPPGALTLPDDCAVLYRPAFLSAAAADALFAATVDAAAWSRTPITFFGQQVLQPRDTAFYGTELYSYSDERRAPLPWGHDAAGEAIRALKFRVEGELGLERDYFNVCLCNRYPDGQSYMGYHSDDEASLGRNPLIASVSVGAERRFLLRPKPRSVAAGCDDSRIEYVLAHGSLLVMSGATQEHYKHSLPRAAAVRRPRVNITFRRVVNS